MAELVDSVLWVPNYAEIHSKEDYQLQLRRHLCDVYMDPRKCGCGGGLTQFHVDGISMFRDLAKAALNVYNEKQQKNFHLGKVVKVNQFAENCYLTFWAKSAESDEHRLFRAAVNKLGGYNDLLCEIKAIRYDIAFYMRLSREKMLTCLKLYPVIATMVYHSRLSYYDQILEAAIRSIL